MKKSLILVICIFLVSKGVTQNNFSISITLSTGEYVYPLQRMDQPVAEDYFDGKYFRYLHFSKIPSAETLTKLANHGIMVHYFLGNNTYQASINAGFPFQSLSTINIDGCYRIEGKTKMHKELIPVVESNNIPSFAINENGHAGIIISRYPNVNHQLLLETILSKGFTVNYENTNSGRMVVFVPTDQIMTLAALPGVAALELMDEQPVPDNNPGRTNHRVNWLSQEFQGGLMYNGTGVSVMLQDDGFIGPHIDYEGRLGAQYVTTNSGDHGDHCAGTLMGAGNKDPLTRGMGWGAELFVYRAAPYQGFDSIYNHYVTNNIVITSTSYSDGCNAGYTTLAQTLDQQIVDMPKLIHVFSGGNNGTADCSYGAGAGWGNVTGGHKHSKNTIAVGNLDFADVIAASSSRGPAHDGRLKPEVCAVGTNVYSTIDVNTYGTKSGTSMACPAVAGTLSALYQAYKETHNNVEPPSALIKAVVMNTSDDLGNPGPDFIYGYGRINARKALVPVQNNQFVEDSVNNSGSRTHNITIPAGVGTLKVMVYWHDRPASVNASVALVNNLNMTVTDPSNNVLQPLILNYTPTVSALSAPAVPGVDIRNNHEQVVINNPAAGNYTITIQGASIPFGPQKYYVVWYYEVAEDLVLTYPNGGEGFEGGETHVVRWDAQGNNGTFSLEYSNDSGATWQLLASNINANFRSYQWLVPNNFSGKCLMNIKRGQYNDVSDRTFSVAPIPTNINVQWSCPDSLMLKWTPVANATGYDIFMLGNMYMDSIGTTAADSFKVYNLNNVTNTYWFSVRARGTNHAVGRRAIAIEKTPGILCPGSYDVAINSVNSPDQTYFGCQNTTSIPVIVELSNPGATPITSATLNYSLNSAAVVTQTYTGNLAPNASTLFTFNTPISITAFGNNILQVWVDYPNDIVPANDTMNFIINYATGVTVTPPWSEDFETFPACATTSDCGVTVCNMLNGFVNATNGQQDDIDWRTDENGTPSSGTGPDIDFIPGTAIGNYIYLEASGVCEDQTAVLFTPCVDLTNITNAELKFGYHMNGADMGTLEVDIFSNGAWIPNVFSRTGPQGSAWQQATINLNAYAGQNIVVRFRGTTGNGFASDMALDGIRVDNLSGVEETVATNQLNVYPNPAQNEIRVTYNAAAGSEAVIYITDLSGRVISSETVQAGANGINATMNISGLAAGLYMIQLQQGNERLSIPLQKMD